MSEKKNYPPSWLNEEYIGKIFSDYVNRGRDQVQSIDWDCEIEYFDKKLENLSTNLFKIKVTNRKNPKEVYNAIAKTLSQKVSNHFEVRLNLQTILFEREGILYENHLNEISKILNKIDENTMIIPKLYYFSVDPLLIIIEDMSSSGFKKYIEPYSLEDCINIFKNLGKFHAASYYLHHECKWDFSECKNFLGQNFVDDAKIMTMAYQDFQEVVATWDNCSEFAEKLKKFEPHYPDSLEKVGKENPPGGINVLSHGDFHKHNFLMRNDVMNCVFIDYQFSTWRSPSYDIIAALNTFCEPEIAFNSKEFLIKTYHMEFKNVLKKLEFSHVIPTLLDIHLEVLKCGKLNLFYWSVYNAMTALYGTHEDKRDFRIKFRDALNSPRQRKLINNFLEFLHQGHLEYDEKDLK